jgi:hypothetical protein
MRYDDSSNESTTSCGRLLVGLCLAFTLLIGTAAVVMAAPKNVATAKPGDCAVCHGKQKVLPADHKATKGMAYKDCLECHEKGGTMRLAAKMPSSHTHKLTGVTCVQCHGKTRKPAEVKMKQCETCHNMDQVVEKTAKVKPHNPHDSPHYGKTLDCNICHHQHAKSENYCSQCHKFDYVVP